MSDAPSNHAAGFRAVSHNHFNFPHHKSTSTIGQLEANYAAYIAAKVRVGLSWVFDITPPKSNLLQFSQVAPISVSRLSTPGQRFKPILRVHQLLLRCTIPKGLTRLLNSFTIALCRLIT